MVKRGKAGRLKRNPSPKFWPIHRKELPWVTRPSSGPHSLGKCLTLTLILRDIIGVAKNRKEATAILSQGKVAIDGKTRRNVDFPVGLMDVIAIPELKKYFRVLPSHKGLVLQSIDQGQSNFKLARIENIVKLSDGISLALHDGSNILIKTSDQENPKEIAYQTFDILKITLPEKKIIDRIEAKEGNVAIITGGKNIGKSGRIVEIEKAEAKKRRQLLVVIQNETGARYQTIMDLVFSIGEAQPIILEANSVV